MHAFRALRAEPARVILVNAPGRMHAGVFTELGTPVADDRTRPGAREGPHVAHVTAVARKWGMTILAPPDG